MIAPSGGFCPIGSSGGIGVSVLTLRRDVIENPEAATVRADDNVVVFHDQVADRGRGHIQSQRLPMLAVVKRYVDGLFRARVEQTFAQRVFAHYVDYAAVGNAVGVVFPGLAAVARAIDVRSQIV